MQNFRFRIGMFGKVILQKKVFWTDDEGVSQFYWEDAKVEDLTWYFASVL